MFVEDFTAFFTLDTPGSATATVSGGNITVLFDNGYQAALQGFAESASPSCQARTADVASLVQGSPITINAIAYKVATVQPDGSGVTTLQLEQA